MRKKKYITYGLGNFDPEKFIEIKNKACPGNKPKCGGLWASPIKSKFGWCNWCTAENWYKNNGLDDHFTFELTDSANVYKISKLKDLIKFPAIHHIRLDKTLIITGFDFEKMLDLGYDAIEVTKNALNLRSSDLDLYGWDCESILILNKNCIKNINNIC